jgi:hypothetical protein
MYIVVANSDSPTYFSDNKATRFRVKLSKPLVLDGDWYVGVCEIHVTDNAENIGIVGFNSDISNGLIVNGIQSHLLRRFNCKRNVHETFPIVYYLPVDKLFIDTLKFYLTGPTGELASLGADVKIEVTLHFQKK